MDYYVDEEDDIEDNGWWDFSEVDIVYDEDAFSRSAGISQEEMYVDLTDASYVDDNNVHYSDVFYITG